MSVSPLRPELGDGDAASPPEPLAISSDLVCAAILARHAIESLPLSSILDGGKRDAFEDAKAGYDVAWETLRKAITDYAVSMRANGTPPEKMIIAVKSTTLDFLPYLSHDAARLAVVHEIVLWAIQGYYGRSANLTAETT
jgi:hypothetical protein